MTVSDDGWRLETVLFDEPGVVDLMRFGEFFTSLIKKRTDMAITVIAARKDRGASMKGQSVLLFCSSFELLA